MLFRVTMTALASFAVLAPAANAATYGSTMQGAANAGFGCEVAPVLDPLGGGVTLTPSGQTTCTWRHTGYINSFRPTSQVPASGSITSIRVKAGANPAPLKLTILSASSKIDFTGHDISGTFSCCTAHYLGRTFRPRANATTRRRVNVRVHSSIDARNLLKNVDVVALSAVGPGTLPLHDQGVHQTFQSGVPLSSFWYPLTARGEPRVEASSMDGYDLLFQWRFKRR